MQKKSINISKKNSGKIYVYAIDNDLKILKLLKCTYKPKRHP